MNPDFPYHKTTDYITYTLTDGNGNTVSFEVRVGRPGQINFTDEHGKTGTYLIDAARNFWNEYVRKGFKRVNKCIHHNMKEFHKACGKAEKETLEKTYEMQTKKIASKVYECIMDEYKREYKNYSLEA